MMAHEKVKPQIFEAFLINFTEKNLGDTEYLKSNSRSHWN